MRCTRSGQVAERRAYQEAAIRSEKMSIIESQCIVQHQMVCIVLFLPDPMGVLMGLLLLSISPLVLTKKEITYSAQTIVILQIQAEDWLSVALRILSVLVNPCMKLAGARLRQERLSMIIAACLRVALDLRHF